MRRWIIIMTAFTLMGVTGCYTTGLSPREYGSSTYTKLVYGLYYDQPESSPQGTFTKPIKLGVAQIGEVAPPKSFTSLLQHSPTLISEVIDIPQLGAEQTGYYQRNEEDIEAETVKFAKRTTAMRKLAKELGADYVFLFGGNIDIETIGSSFTIFDITIIGGAIIPSQTVKAEAKAAGALVDTEDGRVVFLVNTETQAQGLTPTWFLEDKQKRMQIKLRDQILGELGQKFLEKLEAQK
ncbi:MAG TPA: hypothetical protein PLT76_03775 [Candidatus Omnitrophota bacterium]|nr:hypothetical protein [Candidatus Omnitrophota bacterium]HQO57819.1 hypothetical protein [Candidatus Omnitrophota bacterium]